MDNFGVNVTVQCYNEIPLLQYFALILFIVIINVVNH